MTGDDEDEARHRNPPQFRGIEPSPGIDESEDREDADETIEAPSTETTVEIVAGGRRWEGSLEEFKALRHRLNEVDFRD